MAAVPQASGEAAAPPSSPPSRLERRDSMRSGIGAYPSAVVAQYYLYTRDFRSAYAVHSDNISAAQPQPPITTTARPMSLDGENLLGMFTETEIAAGVPYLVFGPSDDPDENNEPRHSTHTVSSQETCETFRRAKCVRLIAGKSDPDEIKHIVYKQLLSDNIDELIFRYAGKESLPAEHISVVRNEHCLEILLKGMIGKVCGIPLTTDLVNEITSLSNSLRRNVTLHSAYHRVSRIQTFLHTIVVIKHGPDAHLRLPVHHMRNLLSAARLHLGIRDIRRDDHNYLAEIIKRSNDEAEKEYLNPRDANLRQGAAYRKHWRVRHIKPVSYYLSVEVRRKLTQIQSLTTEAGLERFQHEILSIYSR